MSRATWIGIVSVSLIGLGAIYYSAGAHRSAPGQARVSGKAERVSSAALVSTPSPLPLSEARAACAHGPRRTERAVKLLGTLVLTDPRRSVALIQVGSEPVIAVRRDHLFENDQYSVVDIARQQMCFQVRGEGKVELVDVSEVPGMFLHHPELFAWRNEVERLGDKHYRVPPFALQKALTQLTEILKTALATPILDSNGKFLGFQIQFIAQDSPFLSLGLEPGDVLTGVNDIVFDNVGKGLTAYQELRGSSHVSLKIQRDGTATALDFEIR